MNFSKEFEHLLNFRRSIRIFDPELKIDEEIIRKCLNQATLAPNSSNLQLWEFFWVRNSEKKEKLKQYCLNQNAAKTAQELIVVVVRKDRWRSRAKFNLSILQSVLKGKESSKRAKMVFNYYGKLIPNLYFSDFWGIFSICKWIIVHLIGLFKPVYRQVKSSDTRIIAHKSAALAAQTLMLAFAAEEIDTCPMEGFDSHRVKKLLQLPYSAEINMIISVGKRKPEGVYGERIRLDNEQVIFEV